MHPHLGALAALGSASLWAFASARYAQASRTLGAPRVNLVRTLIVLPLFLGATLLSDGNVRLQGVTAGRVAWLFLSVLCSYALADGLFFAAARRIGISTALAIASSYPLWAALIGVAVRGEPFGPARVLGTLLCVGGVIALVRRLRSPSVAHPRPSTAGIALALVTSLLWSGNAIAIKYGAAGLPAWRANFVRFLLALPILAVTSSRRPAPAAAYRALIWPSVLEAFIGSSLFVYALSNTDLAVGATLSSTAPLISMPIAVVLGEERWSHARALAVSATVVGAAVLVAS
jgi:drug/metabolite transporter (DMT)-like permease